MKQIKIFETFAGIGGGSFALKKCGIPFECVGYSEINQTAIKCYDKNHRNCKNYGDIEKINFNEVPDFDLLLGGFPCQDVSINGKKDLSGGRTVLVYKLIECLKTKKPKYFLFENVGGIYSKQFKPFLDNILNEFSNCGYEVYHKLLNSSEYGIKQNRDRVWFIGVRKDIDFIFTFPNPTHHKVNLMVVDGVYGMKKSDKQQLDRTYLLKCGIPCLTHSFSKRMVFDGYEERELNKREYCQFMGFEDGDIDVTHLSRNQVASLMGNAWDVNIVSKIFQILLDNWDTRTQVETLSQSSNRNLTGFLEENPKCEIKDFTLR